MNNLEQLSERMLLAAKAVASNTLEQLTDDIGHLDQEILRRAELSGGTEVTDDVIYKVPIKITAQYDRFALTPLKELLPHDELMECWTAEHSEWVKFPEGWDMTQVKKIARKRGGNVAKILVTATLAPKRTVGKIERLDGEIDGLVGT